MNRAWRFGVVLALAGAVPMTALAHVDTGPAADAWSAWDLKIDILGGLALAAALYAAGTWKLRAKDRSSNAWRHTSFFSGLIALFFALQSPLDALAQHSFFMHQIQHLLLQTLAPMLLMLAVPQATLVAGFPAALRRAIVAPVLTSRPVRNLFGFLVHPAMAALLLTATLYAWHWPAYHDRAVLEDGVHYLMHLSMLAAGLLFFSCIFDPRPPPLGPRHGARINALWAAMTACMLLGTALALKGRPLYPAYDELGRLWNMSALADESLGGLVMWIPGSVAWVPAFLVLLRKWDTHEARLHDRRLRGMAAGASAATAANYRVGLLIGLIALGGFAATLAIGWIAHR